MAGKKPKYTEPMHRINSRITVKQQEFIRDRAIIMRLYEGQMLREIIDAYIQAHTID